MKGVFQLFAVDENRLYVIHSLEKANMSDAVSNKGHSCLWDFLHYNDIKRHWVCLSQFTEMIEPYIQDEKIKADFNDIYTIPLFAPPSHQFLWHVVAYNIHARHDIMEFTFSGGFERRNALEVRIKCELSYFVVILSSSNICFAILSNL
jgi:hypothetical protein